MNLADLVTDAATRGFRGLDASLLPELRAIRRDGPAPARRAALLALLHLGGEQALDPADLAVLRRLIDIRLPYDRPHTVDGCFNAWLTVRGADQQGIMQVLGLTRSVPATYGLGETLVAHLGHGGPDRSRTWRHVFMSPRLNGWTVVSGPSCDPDDEPQVDGWIQELSSRYGDAQAYFYGSQGDGDAWLVGSQGRIIRRFSSEKPETSTGEPLPIEHRTLARLGLNGPPERLDTDELWDFVSECGAPQVAAELAIDPVWTGWPADLDVHGHPLIAWPESDADISILRDCHVFHI
ncbi:hypothetical protein AB0F73_02455 [Micromonospora purpureochromogenes]|uniref:hypothetical protein n=1 Tax=Micromonospora purpureochromogenes TaxID=47872 RepID=UPI0033D5FE59